MAFLDRIFLYFLQTYIRDFFDTNEVSGEIDTGWTL